MLSLMNEINLWQRELARFVLNIQVLIETGENARGGNKIKSSRSSSKEEWKRGDWTCSKMYSFLLLVRLWKFEDFERKRESKEEEEEKNSGKERVLSPGIRNWWETAKRWNWFALNASTGQKRDNFYSSRGRKEVDVIIVNFHLVVLIVQVEINTFVLKSSNFFAGIFFFPLYL